MDNQTECHVSEKGSGCSPLKAGVHPTDEMISNSLSQMSNVSTFTQKRKFSETSDDESDDNKRQKIEAEKATSDDQITVSPTFNEVRVETDKDKVVDDYVSADNESQFQTFEKEQDQIEIVYNRQETVEKEEEAVEKPTSDDQTTDSPTFNGVKVKTDKDKVVDDSVSAENESQFQTLEKEQVKTEIVYNRQETVEREEDAVDDSVSAENESQFQTLEKEHVKNEIVYNRQETVEKGDNHVLNAVCNTTEELDVVVVNTNRTNEEEPRLDVPFLYRLLRAGELRPNGISAKDPSSNTSIAEHVANGSNGSSSKYISTSTREMAIDTLIELKNRRRKYRNGCKQKIKIDVRSLPSTVQIIDLRTEEQRRQHICLSDSNTTRERYHRYANAYDEVLLVGDIPRECIQIID